MSDGGASARLPWSRLVAYAAPTVALQAMMVPLLLYLPPTYYSPAVGLSLAVVGAMFLVGRAFEAITDPLIGALSDRTTSRVGRRRLWMLIGTPVAMISGWLLVTPSQGVSAGYLLACLLVFYVGWTMVYIPHTTWGSELASDYHERTRIAGFRETGGFIGYLFASLVPLVWWKYIRGVDAPSFEQIVQAIAAFFIIGLPLFVAWCFFAVPAVQRGEGEQPPSWSELYGILRRNKPFLRLVSAYLIDRLAMGIYMSAQPLLIGYALGMLGDILWIGLANTIAAVLLAPTWVPIARRFGKHRTYVIANGVTMVAYALFFVAQPGQLWILLLCNMIMGWGNGGTMIAPAAMTADSVDYDELKSGVQQMGGHMAFLGFVFKAGMAAGPFFGLGFISLFGFSAAAQTITPTGELGIRLAISVVPILILIIPMAMMWRFPLDARRHDIIRRRLEQRRERSAARPGKVAEVA